MSSGHHDVRVLCAQAQEALKRADRAAARELCLAALAGTRADAATWHMLSRELQALGMPREESMALDRLLEQEPRHLPALIRKGDLYALGDDRRAAVAYYEAAQNLAARISDLSEHWRSELSRIEIFCRESRRLYEAHLLNDLNRRGLGEGGTERFGRAVDMLLGKRQVYHQQPRYFRFPELPEVEFFERSDFAWVEELEAATPQILAELQSVVSGRGGIEPYMQKESRRPTSNSNGLLNDSSWSAFHLFKGGQPVEESARRCPATMATLERVPLCRVQGRTPTVLFSLLSPGAHIPAHNGYINTRLICHLPLIVPAGCSLRVGNETRAWRVGELTIFDDTIEHEAWNRSDQLRAVLLFDIWRPELTQIERSLVGEMLESIDRFGGGGKEWTQ